MTPKVSVIIPVYKVEAYLRDCLDSVLCQTLTDIEVIAVDDRSPDGCPAIIDEYAASDPRVTAVHLEENGGQGIARNVGLARAVGEYVYFLDSDDMIVSEALEALYERAASEDLDGLFFDSRALFETPELAKKNASYVACHKGTYPKEAMTGPELLDLFVMQRDWTCYVQRQLWRRAFLLEEGLKFPTYASHEDEGFAFMATLAARRAAFEPWPFFIRRYRAGSVMTSDYTLKNFASDFMVYTYMLRFMHERGIELFAAHYLASTIRRRMAHNHPLLVDKGVDIAARFEGTEFYLPYLEFADSFKPNHYFMLLSQTMRERTGQAKHIYIYGAGMLGRSAVSELSSEGLAVDGVLVTSMEGNPSTIWGHRVRAIDEVDELPEGSLVIIAVTDGYRAEIEALLDERGWPHIYCKD